VIVSEQWNTRQFKTHLTTVGGSLCMTAVCGRAGAFDLLVHAFSSCQVIKYSRLMLREITRYVNQHNAGLHNV